MWGDRGSGPNLGVWAKSRDLGQIWGSVDLGQIWGSRESTAIYRLPEDGLKRQMKAKHIQIREPLKTCGFCHNLA